MKNAIYIIVLGLFIFSSCGPSEKEKREKAEQNRIERENALQRKQNNIISEINTILNRNFDYSGTHLKGDVEVKFRKVNNCEFEFEKNGDYWAYTYNFNPKDISVYIEYVGGERLSFKADEKYFLQTRYRHSDGWSEKTHIDEIWLDYSSKRAVDQTIELLKVLKSNCN